MNYDLPKSFDICGTEYAIRYDFRPILEICAAMEDPELEKQDKVLVALTVFYPDFENMPPEYFPEAIKQCFWFIDGGEENPDQKGPRLVSWEQDIPYIIAPVNRILGQETRAIHYDAETNTGGLHWWTFLSAFREIGDCTFAQIVRIRNILATRKKMDKPDQEWYRKNKHLVDFKQTYTETEKDILSEWGIK